jgi:hypothetical protein
MEAKVCGNKLCKYVGKVICKRSSPNIVLKMDIDGTSNFAVKTERETLITQQRAAKKAA